MECEFVEKPFVEILCDCLSALDNSYSEVDKGTNKFDRTLVKTSLLHSIYLLECAANCCLYHYPQQKSFLASIDKMPLIDKYEFLLLTRAPEHKLDRGHTLVQGISELITLRNLYVHPKVKSIKVDVHKDSKFEKGGNYHIKLDKGITNILKIPRLSMNWNPGHSIRAIKSVNLFLDYFFRKMCHYTPKEISSLLISEVRDSNGVHRMIRSDAKDIVSKAQARWDFDFSFIYL